MKQTRRLRDKKRNGIGRVRRQWMSDEVGQTGVDLLKSLKKILDPDNILNPGVLIPDELIFNSKNRYP